MRYLIILYIIGSTLVAHGQIKNKPYPPIESNRSYAKFGKISNLSALIRLKNYPFNKATQIKLVSFPGDGGQKQRPILVKPYMPQRRKLEICILPFSEVKLLNQTQVNQLTNIFYNYGYIIKPSVENLYGCYGPQNGILFLDHTGRVFEYLEICFHCHGLLLSSDLVKIGDKSLMEEKYSMFKKFFQDVGITYGVTKEYDWRNRFYGLQGF
jgi:hypothetical protein